MKQQQGVEVEGRELDLVGLEDSEYTNQPWCNRSLLPVESMQAAYERLDCTSTQQLDLQQTCNALLFKYCLRWQLPVTMLGLATEQ